MATGFCLSQLCSTTGVMTLSTLSAVNRKMCLYQSALFMTVVGTGDTVVWCDYRLEVLRVTLVGCTVIVFWTTVFGIQAQLGIGDCTLIVQDTTLVVITYCLLCNLITSRLLLIYTCILYPWQGSVTSLIITARGQRDWFQLSFCQLAVYIVLYCYSSVQ